MIIDNIEIDSFKIRIPFAQCNIIDESLEGNWILVNEATGIIDEADFKKNSMKFNIDGIKIKFAIEKQMTNEQVMKTFIIILINSKILESEYFEGITKINIEKVYKYLISLQVINFTYSDFLQSEITDVDFKRDKYQTNFLKTIPVLYSITKKTRELNEGCNKWEQNDNQGIQFSNRKTTSISRSPFIKIYNKEIELKKGSKDSQLFFKTYLFNKIDIDELISNRIRVEFTVKNKKHFRLFNINKTSLDIILNLSQILKKQMLSEILNKHLKFKLNLTTINHKDNLTPSEIVFISLLQITIDKDFAVSIIIENVIKQIESKQRKSEMKKRLYNLYNAHLLDDAKLKKITNSSQEFLTWLIT